MLRSPAYTPKQRKGIPGSVANATLRHSAFLSTIDCILIVLMSCLTALHQRCVVALVCSRLVMAVDSTSDIDRPLADLQISTSASWTGCRHHPAGRLDAATSETEEVQGAGMRRDQDQNGSLLLFLRF